MAKEYGQFCGLAKASSLVGERWTLLVLRDLSVGPRRFTDLQQGLPGIPTSLLTSRLRDLEEAGVVARQLSERHGGGVLYALTTHGEEFVPILDAIGRWGATTMAEPTANEVITDASLAAALRAGFRPGSLASPVLFQVEAGPAAAWASCTPDSTVVGSGRSEGKPDLVIHAGPALRLLFAGERSTTDALAAGEVRIEGTRSLFETFARAFHVPLHTTES